MTQPEQKTITLVSGANQGIGLATATALARDHGHHVIIGSRSLDAGKRVAESLKAQGHSASSVQLDLMSEESIAAAIKHVETTFGRLDVLVNNAAILFDMTDKYEGVFDLFAQTFATNVVGTAALTEGLFPLLRKSSLPRVVCVSSRMGSFALAKDPTTPYYHLNVQAYDASKAALQMLAINWARILEPHGAKVNVVCPGLVSTNLHPAVKAGHAPEVGAKRIVEMATVGPDGPTATFSDRDGVVPW
ncbi:uncharacterized protein PV09_04677 [Verruconis gallopava]|uniref:Short-chain dehydrogenase/reductase SDR n=1 Tax=Verruconis gallopava TaxID=253628 RepID=A0A0D1YUQ3_9PEZI|nr:uncharacterized protein PV09_04677 [Verruconis gallopava]KIW04397.1 hypothetical protein PV09_04677 [Verruconis gallopava]